jgi:hypothetical protein
MSNWQTAQGIYSQKDPMEGIIKAGIGACRYMWPHKSGIKQQQEVFFELY